MTGLTTLGAIDAGSNAIRVVVAELGATSRGPGQLILV
jgi:exopolyphosphatase/pppGpp-phosphohydrolase